MRYERDMIARRLASSFREGVYIEKSNSWKEYQHLA
jgi:hypothetical protein